MQTTDTHEILIARICKLVDYVADSNKSGIFSIYTGDLPRVQNYPAIKQFGKSTIDEDGLYWFTFGKYGLVPMLSPDQLAEIFAYAVGKRVTIGQIRSNALCGGVINTKYGSVINASFVRTAHQFGLVHGYFSIVKL